VSRQDSSNPRPPLPRRQSTSTSVAGSALKRPHPERNLSTSSDRSVPEATKAISADSNNPPASVLSSNDQDGESQAGKKLKRSSMARGASTTSLSTQRRPSAQGGQNTGLQSPTHSSSNRRSSTVSSRNRHRKGVETAQAQVGGTPLPSTCFVLILSRLVFVHKVLTG